MPLLLAVFLVAGALAIALWYRQRHIQFLRRMAQWTAEWAHKGEITSPPSDTRYPSSLAPDLDRIRRRENDSCLKLEETTFHLQAIMESMPEGAVIVDENHVINLANPRFSQFFDLQRDPAGQTLLQCLREAPVEMLIRKVVSGGETETIEFVMDRPGNAGISRHLQVTAVPLHASSRVTGAVAIFYDITGQKRAEEARREFIANVSHELRTPLSIFRGYLETLLDDESTPSEAKRILQIMNRHSTRLNALVDDLLTLARLELRRIDLEPASIRLDGLLQQITADFTTLLKAKKLAISLDVPAGLPILEADPARLEQVICNLLENAVKYSNPETRILIQARAEKETMVILVRDQGIGIPASDLPFIFERFYRVDKARSREQGGSGLGLSIVKHIVEMHGGTASAESVPGEGTTIRISLPLQRKSLA